MINTVIYNPLNIALFLCLNVLNIFLENKVIIKLLKIEKTKVKEIKLLTLEILLETITYLLLPIQVFYALNILIKTILFKTVLKLTDEKLYLSVIIISIIKTVSETILLIKNKYILAENIATFLEIIMNLCVFSLIKQSKIKITINNYLKENEKNKITIISVLSIISMIIIKIKIIGDLETIIPYLYIIFCIMQTAYLSVLARNILDMIKESNDKITIENLEGNNKRLQENYDNVRAFKHDFNNIMQGIGGFILSKDIAGLDKMYKSIIKECQEINEKQAINKDIITNPAILNLINNKIELAEKNNIKIKVEAYIDLKTLKVSTYDLCRVLGILIDNAIEASIGCDEKIITIKFLRDKFNNRNLIIIENPCKNYLVDIKKIYEKGYSSKKDKISHGLGLWKVKQILKKNKNIKIYTSRDKLFKQQLEIY